MAIAATIPPLRLECPNGDIHSEDVWYDAAAIQLAQLSDGIVALLRAVQTHLERDRRHCRDGNATNGAPSEAPFDVACASPSVKSRSLHRMDLTSGTEAGSPPLTHRSTISDSGRQRASSVKGDSRRTPSPRMGRHSVGGHSLPASSILLDNRTAHIATSSASSNVGVSACNGAIRQISLASSARSSVVPQGTVGEGSTYSIVLVDDKNPEIIKLFRMIDVDQDSTLSKREFARFLAAVDKKKFTLPVVNELFNYADADHDGQVSYQEFLAWVTGNAIALPELASTLSSRPVMKLLQEGYSVQELRNWGFTIQDLNAANCTLRALRNAGFTTLEVKLALKSPNQELVRAGFNVPNNFQEVWPSAKQLKAMGFSLQQLRASGYQLKDLYKGGYTVQELKVVFAGRELRQWANSLGLSSLQLREMGFTWDELKLCGFTLRDLVEQGFSVEELAEVNSLADLCAAGVSAADMRSCLGVDIEDLKCAGYSVEKLREIGCSAQQAKALEFSPFQLARAGYPVLPALADSADWPSVEDLLQSLRGVKLDVPVTANSLQDSGYTEDDTSAIFGVSEVIPIASLVELGYTLPDLKLAGFSATEMRRAGHTAREIYDAMFSIEELKDSGHSAVDLVQHGVSVEELAPVYPVRELRLAQVTAKELHDQGVSLQAMKDAGFSLLELRDVGCSASEAKQLGFSPKELAESGYEVFSPIAHMADWPDVKDALRLLRGLRRDNPVTAADFFASGYSQTELNSICSVDKPISIDLLRELGYTAADLRAVGLKAGDLLSAGLNSGDMYDEGFTVPELAEGGSSLNELYSHGVPADQLQTVFSLRELRVVGVSAKQLAARGTEIQALHEAGYSLSELAASGCTAGQARLLGSLPRELAAHGFTVLPVLAWRAEWPTLETLLKELRGTTQQAPFTGSELFLSGFAHEEIADCCDGGEHISPNKLRQLGYEMRDLRLSGFSPGDLHAAKFSAQDAFLAGFSITELRRGGYQLQEFLKDGFRIGELYEVYSAEELRHAGVRADQLLSSGATFQRLHEAGYSLLELRDAGCNAVQAKELGFNPKELKKNGYKVIERLEYQDEWPSVEDLLLDLRGVPQDTSIRFSDLYGSGFSTEDIMRVCDPDGLLSVAKLQELGYTLHDLRVAAFSPRKLLDANFTVFAMYRAGFTAQELQDGGVTLQDLHKNSVSMDELISMFSPKDLREAGVTAAELSQSGIGIKELRDAGYSLTELREAGCTAAEARDLGFVPRELSLNGYRVLPAMSSFNNCISLEVLLTALRGVPQTAPLTAADLLQSGFSEEEIYEFCEGGDFLSIGKLQDLGYELLDLKAAGYMAGDLSRAGFRARDMRDVGFTAREVMLSKCHGGSITPVMTPREGK